MLPFALRICSTPPSSPAHLRLVIRVQEAEEELRPEARQLRVQRAVPQPRLRSGAAERRGWRRFNPKDASLEVQIASPESSDVYETSI